MTLYTVSEIYKDLIQLYNESESQGELDSILEQIESVEATLEEKVENFAKIIIDAQADAKKYKAEIDRLKGLEMVAVSRADRLKASIKSSMELTGNKKLEIGIFKVSIQANGGNPAVEIADGILTEDGWIENPETLPDEAKKFVPAVPAHFEIDRAGIVAMQKEGKDLPEGITTVRGTQLRIK